jgi:hypothetical protein
MNLLFKKREEAMLLIKNSFIGGCIFLIAISYWLIPALMRSSPVEQRLDQNHWEAFSAGSYKGIDPCLNVASLNGFWGERNTWAGYFLWPQDNPFFWVSFGALVIFMLIGLVNGLKNKKTRKLSLFFGFLAVTSYILSLGVAETYFKGLNMWLFEHVSFWAGFRDTQKFSGFLALTYAFFAGLGFINILEYLKKKDRNFYNMFLSFVFIIPILFGFFVWGGFHKQIRPVFYPDSWVEAKKAIGNEGKILFLPWHMYFSLDFNNKIVTANPSRRFFGERIIAGKNVELGDIHDQVDDKEYHELDSIITEAGDIDEKIKLMKDKFVVRYIVKINDLDGADNIDYSFLYSSKLETVYKVDGIRVYRVRD